MSTQSPELKQVWALTAQDFERFPVWIGVHNADFGEPWYDLADEATYRPWADAMPASPAKGHVIAWAASELHNGARHCGFVKVVGEDWDVPPPPRKMRDGTVVRHRSFTERYGGSLAALLGLQQPRLFVDSGQVNFWGGRKGVTVERRQAFYAAIGADPEVIFPIRFNVEPALAVGIIKGAVNGFYHVVSGAAPVVEL